MHKFAGHEIVSMRCSLFGECELYFTVYYRHLTFDTAGHADHIISLTGEVEILAVAVRADTLLTLPQLGLVILFIIRRIFYF